MATALCASRYRHRCRFHRVRPASRSGPIAIHATRNRLRAPPARSLRCLATSRSAAVLAERWRKPSGHHWFAASRRAPRRVAPRRWRRHARPAPPSIPNMPPWDILNAPCRRNAPMGSSIFRLPASAFLFLPGASSPTSPALRLRLRLRPRRCRERPNCQFLRRRQLRARHSAVRWFKVAPASARPVRGLDLPANASAPAATSPTAADARRSSDLVRPDKRRPRSNVARPDPRRSAPLARSSARPARRRNATANAARSRHRRPAAARPARCAIPGAAACWRRLERRRVPPRLRRSGRRPWWRRPRPRRHRRARPPW
jgi:hypothetical protein